MAAIVRRDATARLIVRAWRRLLGDHAGSATTLVACSGGADSTALALALASVRDRIVLAHVLHDMRPRPEAEGDRDATRALAERLGVGFVQAEAPTRGRGGNAEGMARRGRYRALVVLAREVGAVFIATGHHADDQFESMVMALLRGAGPAGLRGVAEKRELGNPEGGAVLIRPMLEVTRAEARGLCALAGVEWREDATNADTTRLRSALRHGPLAEMSELRPGSAGRAARSAGLLRDAAEVVALRATEVFGELYEWPRGELRREVGIVVGEGLRSAARRLMTGVGGRGGDRLSGRVVDPVVRAIRGEGTEPRSFDWPGGIEVWVRARRVTMVRAGDVEVG